MMTSSSTASPDVNTILKNKTSPFAALILKRLTGVVPSGMSTKSMEWFHGVQNTNVKGSAKRNLSLHEVKVLDVSCQISLYSLIENRNRDVDVSMDVGTFRL